MGVPLEIVAGKATYVQSRSAGEQRKEGTTAQALREVWEQVEERSVSKMLRQLRTVFVEYNSYILHRYSNSRLGQPIREHLYSWVG
jgi:hypothetical protein